MIIFQIARPLRNCSKQNDDWWRLVSRDAELCTELLPQCESLLMICGCVTHQGSLLYLEQKNCLPKKECALCTVPRCICKRTLTVYWTAIQHFFLRSRSANSWLRVHIEQLIFDFESALTVNEYLWTWIFCSNISSHNLIWQNIFSVNIFCCM